MTITTTSYLFDPRPNFPLLVAAKQYQDTATSSSDPDAFTLVFTHANGLPKETWEPCIDDLFALIRKSGVKIKDVWAIEAPNQGEASLVNEPILEASYRPIFRWEDYARAVHCVLTGQGTGITVDFSKRRLFGIGHSLGSTALILSTTFQPPLAWSGLVLTEAMLWPIIPPSRGVQAVLVAGALKRRDNWASADEARSLLLSKAQWQAWEKRAFDLYIKYGLRPVDEKAPGGAVTLQTSKVNEAACFEDRHGTTRGWQHIPTLIESTSIHMVYGADGSYIPKDLQEDIANNLSGGRIASLTRISGAGHLVTVTHPKQMADTIHKALEVSLSSSGPASSSKNNAPSKLREYFTAQL